MSAILIAGVGLWLLAKVSKVLVGLCLLVLFFWLFPMKALMVLLIFAVMLTSL